MGGGSNKSSSTSKPLSPEERAAIFSQSIASFADVYDPATNTLNVGGKASQPIYRDVSTTQIAQDSGPNSGGLMQDPAYPHAQNSREIVGYTDAESGTSLPLPKYQAPTYNAGSPYKASQYAELAPFQTAGYNDPGTYSEAGYTDPGAYTGAQYQNPGAFKEVAIPNSYTAAGFRDVSGGYVAPGQASSASGGKTSTKSLTGGDYDALQKALYSGAVAGLDKYAGDQRQYVDQSLADRGIYTSGAAIEAQNDLAGEIAASYEKAGSGSAAQRYAMQLQELAGLNDIAARDTSTQAQLSLGNAQMQNQYALQSAGMANDFNLQSAGMYNDAQRAEANARNAYGLDTAGLSLQQSLAGNQYGLNSAEMANTFNQNDAAARNQYGLTAADMSNTFNQTNAQNRNQYGLTSAGMANDFNLSQSLAGNEYGLAGTQMKNEYGLADAAAANDWGMKQQAMQNAFSQEQANQGYASQWAPYDILMGLWNETGGTISKSKSSGFNFSI